jgi:hypothetical protein
MDFARGHRPPFRKDIGLQGQSLQTKQFARIVLSGFKNTRIELKNHLQYASAR